jgi:cytochrome c peroxidase
MIRYWMIMKSDRLLAAESQRLVKLGSMIHDDPEMKLSRGPQKGTCFNTGPRFGSRWSWLLIAAGCWCEWNSLL